MDMKAVWKAAIPVLAMAMASCMQDNGGSPGADPAFPAAGEAGGEHGQFAQLIREHGFDTEGMVESREGFLVEGDIYLSKENLLASREAPLGKAAQRTYSDLMSDANANRVRLLIHSSISAWTQEIVQAVNSWNSLNTGAHIYIVTSNPTSTIASDTWTGLPSVLRNLADSVCGATQVITGANPPPSPYVGINMDSQRCNLQADAMERIHTLTHELGHVLRLSHTDGTNPLINGTPASDYSVMNSRHEQAPGYPSIWDKKALHILYPQDIPLFSTNLDLDTRDDITFWRPANGTWYSLKSSTNFSSTLSRQWGQMGDVPLGNTDIDGDGKSDLVVWRPDDATFYIKTSGSNYTTVSSYQMGGNPDIPLPGMNVDSDNKDDLVLWQWSTGNFYILTSTSGYTSFLVYQWGQYGDIPVPSTDLDFDGKEDLVVYRPTNGTWYVKKSSTNFTTSASYQLGNIGSIPLAGSDYNNDGKDEITVLNPWTGEIMYKTSSSGFTNSAIWSMGGFGNTPIGETSVDSDNLSDLLVWNRLDNTWRARTQSSNYNYTPSWTFGM